MGEPRWSVEIPSGPDAPVGVGRLWADGVYVGTLELAAAILVVAELNELERLRQAMNDPHPEKETQ